MSLTPFRWNLARREQLGRLLQGDMSPGFPDLVPHLRDCGARVLALSDNSHLVFLGRSPESVFDYLSGALHDTSWTDRLILLNISLKGSDAIRPSSAPFNRFCELWTAARLDPRSIVSAERPTALVDLVYEGETFGQIVGLLEHWAGKTGIDWKIVQNRLRFVGITKQRRTSPKTWRWQQQLAWARTFRPRALRSVSINAWLWTYLGDQQAKVTDSFPPARWDDESVQQPPRARERLDALRLASYVFDSALDPGERELFAGQLALQPEIRQRWLRQLALQVRNA